MLQNLTNESLLILKYMYSEIFQIPVGTVTPLGGGLFLDPLPPKDMADILETTAPPLVVIFGTTNCFAMCACTTEKDVFLSECASAFR